jgi:two-component system, chemotaxis family, CheB/CheR fusion protein
VKSMSAVNEKSSAGTNPIIAGVGASAGGVQALQTLFDALPRSTGAAFVVMVHLDPQAHSDLARILALRTPMPIVQVQRQRTVVPR